MMTQDMETYTLLCIVCNHGLRYLSLYCQTSDLGLRLEVDFVSPLSQEEEEEQQLQPLTKIYRTDKYYRSGIWHIDI